MAMAIDFNQFGKFYFVFSFKLPMLIFPTDTLQCYQIGNDTAQRKLIKTCIKHIKTEDNLQNYFAYQSSKRAICNVNLHRP